MIGGPLGSVPFGGRFVSPIYDRVKSHRKLLTTAEEWITNREYGVSMIVAQTALEVVTVEVIDELSRKKGIEWVTEPLLIGRSPELASDRTRLIYSGLSGDDIQ